MVGPDGSVYASAVFEGVHGISPTGTRKWYVPVKNTTSLSLGSALYATGEDALIALDLQTGQEKWRRPLLGWARGSAVDRTGTIVYATADNTLYSVNAMTGAVNWSRALPGSLYSGSGSIPSIDRDGNVVLAVFPENWGAFLARITPDGIVLPTIPLVSYGEEATTVVHDRDGGYFLCNLNNVIGVRPGGSVWRRRLTPGYNCDGAPTLDATGTVYVSDAINLYALRGTTGEVLWSRPMGASGETGASALILSNGHVVIPNEAGLWIFASDSKPLEAAWSRGGGGATNSRRAN
jgi:outer membrane protein assembly factor BamB